MCKFMNYLCHFFFFFFFLDLFFWCGPFLKSLLNLLQYCFCSLCCFFGREACGILAPRPGIEPALPAVEGEVPATGPPGRSLSLLFLLLSPNTTSKSGFLEVLSPTCCGWRTTGDSIQGTQSPLTQCDCCVFTFFHLIHRGQNLSLQNHTDLGLEGTWLLVYQIRHPWIAALEKLLKIGRASCRERV